MKKLKKLLSVYTHKRKLATSEYKIFLRSMKLRKKVRKACYPLIFSTSYKKEQKIIQKCNKEKTSFIEFIEKLKNEVDMSLSIGFLNLKKKDIETLEDCLEFAEYYQKTINFMLRNLPVLYIPVTKFPFFLNIFEFLGVCGFLLIFIKLVTIFAG